MEQRQLNYFKTLNDINVNNKTDKKNGLNYLSWAWAWAEVKKVFPDATYTIYEDANGCMYHTDGRTCWVKTGVTVNGIEHIEYLPVMDFKNKSIPLESVTSFDANKAVQRSLTKCAARHGLGLYIYAGEDLPEEEAEEREEDLKANTRKTSVEMLRAQIVELSGHDEQWVNSAVALVYHKPFLEMTYDELADCKVRIVAKAKEMK